MTRLNHSPKDRSELNLLRKLSPYAEKIKLGRVFGAAKAGLGLRSVEREKGWLRAEVSLRDASRELHLKPKPGCEEDAISILERL